MRLYHLIEKKAAVAILEAGFRDATGLYFTNTHHTGVWLGDVPMDINERPTGNALLEVMFDLPDADIVAHEWLKTRNRTGIF